MKLNYEIEYVDNGAIIRETHTPWTEVVPYGENDDETPVHQAFSRMLFEDFQNIMKNKDWPEDAINLKLTIEVEPLQ